MDKEYLKQKLNDLINLPRENETVEFKEANTSYDFSKLGKYFSALDYWDSISSRTSKTK